jgi:long-chain acyl-CoA synthetase
MKGDWNKPEETENAFLELDGKKWLRTGDLVKMDEEGYIAMYDRKKDLIKYKGYSIFAREVEEVLRNHPAVDEAAVIGVPHKKYGQIVKAVIVLESEYRGKVSENDILDYCKENLAPYKVPSIIEFRGEIPKTDVGKVSREELRKLEEEIYG